MPAVTNNNPTWLKLMRALGAPIPEAPLLQRASGAWRDDELQDLHYTYLGQGSFIDLALPGIRSAAEGQRQGIVVDATGWTDLRALDELLAMLQPRIAQLKANDRIVLLSHTTSGVDWQRATIAEALTGFCKSLAKELGSKGITVNQLQVVARGEEATLPWLAFLLSKRSAFVTGQSIAVSIPRRHIGLKPAALQDKVVAITGAAQGIGLAIASQFAAEGAKVIGIDRPGNPALQSAMAAINAQALELDITATDAPQRIRDLAQQLGSGLDVLVNNAGITRDKRFKNMPADYWQSALDVNLHAPYHLAESLAQNGLNDDGRIIFLSSISGVAGNAGQSNYALAKSGLIGLTHALAPAMQNRRITVNAVAPGFIETPMTAAIPFMIREVARRFNALSQGGLPQDVAELVVFLSRPESGGVNGETIRVCGLNQIGR
jgi:3-oxoacyl-[acyl-carrier protein] reductase